MNRILEPEVMNGLEQSQAYADADFEEPDRSFVARFTQTFPKFQTGQMLDLGCGPAAIARYVCEALPLVAVTGVDASQSMIDFGLKKRTEAGLNERIELVCGYLPGALDDSREFDAAISNSLLHHLPEPSVLWNEIKRLVKPGSPVLMIDLFRPDSVEAANAVVETYSANEPEVLKVDFFNSLCAAFTLEELGQQLADAELSHLTLSTISDRHIAVWGAL